MQSFSVITGVQTQFAQAEIIDNFEDIEPQVMGLVVKGFLFSRNEAYGNSPAKLFFKDVTMLHILEICFWKWKFEAAGVADASNAINDLIYQFRMLQTYNLFDMDSIADDPT